MFICSGFAFSGKLSRSAVSKFKLPLTKYGSVTSV